jgi:riboflavin biosynthesis pyrimidine reductase
MHGVTVSLVLLAGEGGPDGLPYQTLAGDRVVAVTGGTIARQCLDLGLLDEVAVDLVPVVMGEGNRLCVPKTLSTSCDQAVFIDQATDASLPSDAVVLKVDQFG